MITTIQTATKNYLDKTGGKNINIVIQRFTYSIFQKKMA